MMRGWGEFLGKRARMLCFFLGSFAAILMVVAAGPVRGNVQQAKMADAFVDSIGVNTHLPFLDTAYNHRYPLVKEKLGELGVRHARDGAFVSSNAEMNELVYGRYRELAELGIRFDLIVDPRKEGLASVDAAKIARVSDMAGASLESFEGPNEYNLSGDQRWGQVLAAYQKNLYEAVKSNPSTSETPVVSPALGRPYPSEKPDLSAHVDYANMHSYPGGRMPSDWGLDNYIVPAARAVGGTKPMTATETGYHTAAGWSGAHPQVSEKAMGKYMPRLLLEYFNRGISRTYMYEFMDQKPDPQGSDREKTFGLLRNDGTEKPAYGALRNLIDLLEDPGPDFETRPLDYSLGGDLQTVHRTLLQKRDGRSYLVLWQEASSYDLKTKRDIEVPNRRVTLTLNQPIDSAATYRPVRSSTPVERYATPRQLTLHVPDAPLVVELTPPGGASVNSTPTITDTKPSAGSRTRDRTPTISATVGDAEIELLRSEITLFVDGRRSTRFSYEPISDRLVCKTSKLQAGRRHTVRIIAKDPQGPDASKQWRFRVVG